MSYRAFKRLLGETSLERKCRFLFGSGVFVLITLSFGLYTYKTEHLAYGQAEKDCRLLVAPSLLQQHLIKRNRSEKDKFDKTKFVWQILAPVEQPGNLEDILLKEPGKEALQFHFLNDNFDDPYEDKLYKEFQRDASKLEDSRLRPNDQVLIYYAPIQIGRAHV